MLHTYNVVGVHYSRGSVGAKDLSDEVERETAPWKTAVNAVSKSYGGIQVGAAVASDVYPEHDA